MICIAQRPFAKARSDEQINETVLRPVGLVYHPGAHVAAEPLEKHDGHIVTELTDAATGTPLPGYAFADCHPLQEDGTAIAVRWKQHHQVATQRRPIRIRIRLAGNKTVVSS